LRALDNGLARTPPMGWNSWNKFACNVSEDQIKQAADAKRFPSGIKALADYVHAKGLKFGMYSDAGTGTCQNRPGARLRIPGCPPGFCGAANLGRRPPLRWPRFGNAIRHEISPHQIKDLPPLPRPPRSFPRCAVGKEAQRVTVKTAAVDWSAWLPFENPTNSIGETMNAS